MSQLTFDSFIDKDPVALGSEHSSWYKGRVLSHSSIGLYRTCPLKWKFRYIDKVPEKPRSFFSFGKSVHTGLEFLFSQLTVSQPTLLEVLSHFKSNWLREGYETPEQERWFYQEGERILRGFYAKHQGDFQKVLHVEFKFTVMIEGVPVTGFIDRIDKASGDAITIIDYKTGKAFDKLRVRTDPQLTLYQMACRELLGKEVVSLTLYHLNSLTPLTVPAHSKSLEDQVRASVVEAAQGITQNQFEPKPDKQGHCQWCDYKQICPAFAGSKALSSPLPRPLPEPLDKLVDRYGKLDMKAKELSQERDLIGQTLLEHLQESGRAQADGEFFSVHVKPLDDGESAALDVTPVDQKRSS